MYDHHPAARLPDSPAARIWRYIDFTKFVALLQSSALYFPRLSALQDRFEGSLTRPIVDEILHVPDDAGTDAFVERMQKAGKALSTFALARQLLFVSSWYMDEHESAAMWKLYMSAGDGVAIRSSFERLRDSLRDPRPIAIGVVNYVDYERERIQWNNLFHLGLHKRKSFEYERELRAIVMDGNVTGPGTAVAVDLNVLIDDIYVAPTCASWVESLVRDVISRYGFDWRVNRSVLGQDPLY